MRREISINGRSGTTVSLTRGGHRARIRCKDGKIIDAALIPAGEDWLAKAIEAETRFGVGASFAARRDRLGAGNPGQRAGGAGTIGRRRAGSACPNDAPRGGIDGEGGPVDPVLEPVHDAPDGDGRDEE